MTYWPAFDSAGWVAVGGLGPLELVVVDLRWLVVGDCVVDLRLVEEVDHTRYVVVVAVVGVVGRYRVLVP